MSDQKPTTQYTITAAHRITGKSRTTIQKHIKKGKLSFTEGADGAKLIDASELIRVYGDDCDFSAEEGGSAEPSRREEGGDQLLAERLQGVQERLDTLEQERRREREQLQAQIEQLQESLKLAQEGQNRMTLLLEDRSGDSAEWGERLKSVEERIDERVARVQREAKREAFEEIKSLPWWRVALSGD